MDTECDCKSGLRDPVSGLWCGRRQHAAGTRSAQGSSMRLHSRRAVLAGATAVPLFAIGNRRASAADFMFKLANNSPVTHPQSIRQQEAAARIKAATGGRVD